MAAISTMATIAIGGVLLHDQLSKQRVSQRRQQHELDVQAKNAAAQLEQREAEKKRDEENAKRRAAQQASAGRGLQRRNRSQQTSNNTILTSPLGAPAPRTTGGASTVLGS